MTMRRKSIVIVAALALGIGVTGSSACEVSDDNALAFKVSASTAPALAAAEPDDASISVEVFPRTPQAKPNPCDPT